MIKRLSAFLLLVFPQWVLAAQGEKYLDDGDKLLPGFFSPPATDTSIYLLGKIFGVVGGVLSGNSLIFGELFYVFNIAVLAVGSIVLIYIIFVSTLNTCGEGEVLGRKWSSIFIPLRAVGAVALMLPGTTGYSAIQVFVMWVAIQGVGLADRLWDTTADFLSRGGEVLMQDPTVSMGQFSGPLGTGNNPLQERPSADAGLNKAQESLEARSGDAGSMLKNISCMMVLENEIRERQKRQCRGSQDWWCQPVPNFAASVNISAAGQEAWARQSDKITVKFPDFDSGYANSYAQLNGVCGRMEWDAMTQDYARGQLTGQAWSNDISSASVDDYIDDDLVEMVALSRVVAIQQMYLDMGNLAQVIVNNDDLADSEAGDLSLPLGTAMPGPGGQVWADPKGNKPALLQGRELIEAAGNYYTIMAPTLNLINNNIFGLGGRIKILNTAKKQGWILAGSYFYDVAGFRTTQQDFNEDQDKLSVSDNWTLDATPQSPGADNPGFEALKRDLAQSGFLNAERLRDKADALIHHDIKDYVSDAAAFGVGKEQQPYDVGVQNNPTMGAQAFSAVSGFGIDGEGWRFKGGIFNMMGSIGSLLFNMLLLPILNIFMTIASAPVALMMMGINIVLSVWIIMWAGMIEQIMSNSINPLVGVALIGNMLLDQSVTAWQAIMLGFVTMLSNIPLMGAGLALLMFMGPILLAILMILFSAGLVLGYYIPLMPYIFFILGGLAWMMAVIEAMVAAPLVALGIMHPEGHEVFGKAGDSAIPLLFNLFLRPAMMVMGFIGAILLSYAAIQLLHFGISRVLTPIISIGNTDVLMGIGTSLVSFSGIAKAAAILTVYVAMHIVLLEKAFSLIYVLPDQVLRWVFAGFRDHMAQDTAQMAQKVSGALTSGANQVAQFAAHRQSKAWDRKQPDGGVDVNQDAPGAGPPPEALARPPADGAGLPGGGAKVD